MAIGTRATGLTGFRNSTGQTVYVEAVGMSATELGPGGGKDANVNRRLAQLNAPRRRGYDFSRPFGGF